MKTRIKLMRRGAYNASKANDDLYKAARASASNANKQPYTAAWQSLEEFKADRSAIDSIVGLNQGDEKMKVYKLTDQNMRTYGGFQWELGVKPEPRNGKGDLCGPGWFHCYSHPLLAVLFNPIHADISNPRLFEATAVGKSKHDNGMKSGYVSLKLTKEIPVPEITLTQKVAFSILVSKLIYKDSKYNKWADNWLSGHDRSAESATSAARSAASAARSAAWSAENAAWSAESAERCAERCTAIDFVLIALEAMKY